MIWSLIVGGLIGLLAGKLTNKEHSMNLLGKILAGLIGSGVGQFLLGNWGPKLAGMALVPSVLGAALVILAASALVNKRG